MPVRVLFLSPSRIASAQIAEMPFRALESTGSIEVRALFDDASDLAERRAALDWADVTFFFRAFDPAALELLRAFRARGKPAIYALDDDFPRLPADSPLGRLYHARANAAAQRALVAEADVVWVFTEAMAERYRGASRRIVVGRLPSPLELIGAPPGSAVVTSAVAASADASSAEAEASPESSPTADAITIGYAGRFVHQRDLAIAVRPLLRLLDAPGSRVRLELVDCIPDALRGHPRVRFTPYFDELADYYRYMASARWTIGLALLADDEFNRGKTDNKYREYAAFGIPGIYSDMPVYAGSVRDGVNGILTPNTEDGVAAALERLVESAELRRRIRDAALRDVSERYSLRAMVAQLAHELSALLGTDAGTSVVAPGQVLPSIPRAADVRAAPASIDRELPSVPRADEIVEPPAGSPEGIARLTGVRRYALAPLRDGWLGVDLLLGTHGKRVAGAIRLCVLDRDGATIRSAEADLGSARDNAWLTFRFEPIERSAGQRFVLELTIAPGSRRERISVYESEPPGALWRRALDLVDRRLPLLPPRATLHARTRYRA